MKSGTAWKVSKYGVFSGPFFPVLGLNTGKYRLEKNPYLDILQAMWNLWKSDIFLYYTIHLQKVVIKR